MKTIFTLGLVLCVCANSFAITSYQIFQTNFRWRNNNGGETSATWKAAQNAAVSGYNGREVVRLRIEIVNTSTGECPIPEMHNCGASIVLNDSLQYSTTPSDTGSWKNISLDMGKPFIIMDAGGYVAQDEVTTSQLADASQHSFSPGKIMVTDTVLKSIIPYNSRTEYEWSLAGTSLIQPGTTYYFRQKFEKSSPYVFGVYTYSTYPSITTGSVLPVTISGFIVSREDKKVKLEWLSASEQNTAYFNIQRSTDAQTWQTVSKVNAEGATSSFHQYIAYDYNPPLSGTVYYRLAEVDKAGKVSLSNIALVAMTGGNPSVSLFPNPASNVATMQFAGTAGKKYSVMITNLTGKTIWQKEGIAVQGNNQVALPIKNLATGMYFIRLINGSSVQNLKLVKGE